VSVPESPGPTEYPSEPFCRPWLPLLSPYKAIPLLAMPLPEVIELMWNK
jgi:hypothetical protein